MTRALVLLHGFTGTAASWDELIRWLPPGTLARAEPLLGHGPLSEPEPESFLDEVERLAARIRNRGPVPVEVVGYSMGARLALALAVHHPSLVSRAWLVGAQPGLSTEAGRSERSREDDAWAHLLETSGLARFVDEWEARPLFASQRALPDAVRQSERARRLSHDPRGLARALRVLGLGAMPDLRPSLSALRVPVQLLVGEADTKFRGLAAEMAEALPEGSLRVIPGAGHNIPLEQPRALAAALTEVHA